jgi:hypothetical protein
VITGKSHLDAVDQSGGQQRAVHRQAAVRAQRYLGLLLEPGDDVDGIAAHDGRIRPVEGSSSVVDTTVAGRLLIRVTHGSRTSDSSVPEASSGAEAVEAGKDVEGVGSGHDPLPECG